MKRNTAVALLLAGLVAVLIVPIAFSGSDVAAQSGKCSLQTLKGNYAARISGWSGSGDTRVPIANVGFVNLDGRGNVTGESTASVDGVITQDIPIVGTYTVDPDTCTGEATSTIGNFFFVIADNGKQTRIIATDTGTTVDGEALRQ
jgi:hypothetical protein